MTFSLSDLPRSRFDLQRGLFFDQTFRKSLYKYGRNGVFTNVIETLLTQQRLFRSFPDKSAKSDRESTEKGPFWRPFFFGQGSWVGVLLTMFRRGLAHFRFCPDTVIAAC